MARQKSNKKLKRLDASVDEEVLEQLEALAEAESRSLSQMIHLIIRLGLKHHPSTAGWEEGKPS